MPTDIDAVRRRNAELWQHFTHPAGCSCDACDVRVVLARLDALEAALRPWADKAAMFPPSYVDERPGWDTCHHTVGEYRRAKEVLNG